MYLPAYTKIALADCSGVTSPSMALRNLHWDWQESIDREFPDQVVEAKYYAFKDRLEAERQQVEKTAGYRGLEVGDLVCLRSNYKVKGHLEDIQDNVAAFVDLKDGSRHVVFPKDVMYCGDDESKLMVTEASLGDGLFDHLSERGVDDEARSMIQRVLTDAEINFAEILIGYNEIGPQTAELVAEYFRKQEAPYGSSDNWLNDEERNQFIAEIWQSTKAEDDHPEKAKLVQYCEECKKSGETELSVMARKIAAAVLEEGDRIELDPEHAEDWGIEDEYEDREGTVTYANPEGEDGAGTLFVGWDDGATEDLVYDNARQISYEKTADAGDWAPGRRIRKGDLEGTIVEWKHNAEHPAREVKVLVE